jgi:hypothetical protein
MTDHASVGLAANTLYERPPCQLLAIMRARRVVPGPQDPSHARALRSAARGTGRTVVEVSGGGVLLGWDADTEGVWAGEGMDAVRSARPAQPRLLRALAACLRCCWVDPDAPVYPAGSADIEDVLAAVLALGGPTEASESGLTARRQHARGALTTLDAAGLIVLDERAGSVSLGPVIATWSERDVAVLRDVWPRLPEPPTDRRSAGIEQSGRGR